jgi:LysM repeat protein
MRLSKPVLRLAIVLLPCASLYAQPANLKPNIPDRYVVRPGDTLWGIAERFTDSPQQWTEIWQLNKQQIKNPNVLRPGEVIRLHSGVAAEKLPPPALPTPSSSGSASSGSASTGGATSGGTSGSTGPRPSPGIEPTTPWPRPPRRE